jgi:hypothetical protein
LIASLNAAIALLKSLFTSPSARTASATARSLGWACPDAISLSQASCRTLTSFCRSRQVATSSNSGPARAGAATASRATIESNGARDIFEIAPAGTDICRCNAVAVHLEQVCGISPIVHRQ